MTMSPDKDMSAVFPLLRVRIAMFSRSLLIQATNNFESMQSLGFTFCLYPLLKWLYRDDETAIRDRLNQHLTFFNTHPYFANCVLGVVGRQEIDNSITGETSSDVLLQVKRSMSGAFGGLGDSLFWATLVPMTALNGLIIIILWDKLTIPGVLVTLILYSIPQLLVRSYMMHRGLRDGKSIVLFLKQINVPRWIVLLSFYTSFLLGVFTIVYLSGSFDGTVFGFGVLAISICIIVIMQISIKYKSIPGEVLWAITLGGTIIYTLVY